MKILIKSRDFPKSEKSKSSTLVSVYTNLFTPYPAQGDIENLKIAPPSVP